MSPVASPDVKSNLLQASRFTLIWFFGLLIGVGALRPEYDHATKAISELGAWEAPYMFLWNALGFVGTGLLMVGFVRGYRSVLQDDAVAEHALLLTAIAFCLSAVPIVIGSDGDPDLGSGWTRAHMIAVLIGPLPWLYATVRIAARYWRSSWRRLAQISLVASAALVVGLVVSMAQIFPETPGLVQRLSFIPYLAWYSLASSLLLRGAHA